MLMVLGGLRWNIAKNKGIVYICDRLWVSHLLISHTIHSHVIISSYYVKIICIWMAGNISSTHFLHPLQVNIRFLIPITECCGWESRYTVAFSYRLSSKVTRWPNQHVFGLLEETGAPWGNTRLHTERLRSDISFGSRTFSLLATLRHLNCKHASRFSFYKVRPDPKVHVMLIVKHVNMFVPFLFFQLKWCSVC